jgi:ABC-type glycerol-3-phosphate transport system permease component
MYTLWRVVMPAVKPAWITLFIFSFQSMWGVTGNIFIYKENLKPISYALQQIASVGIARQGVTAAVSLIMFLIPITIYIFMQSNVLETMSTSGMKD